MNFGYEGQVPQARANITVPQKRVRFGRIRAMGGVCTFHPNLVLFLELGNR